MYMHTNSNYIHSHISVYKQYAQSTYKEFGFQRVRLKQTLNSKGCEFSCPSNSIGSLPESSTQGLLVGKLLVGGLGGATIRKLRISESRPLRDSLWAWELHPLKSRMGLP